MKLKLFSCNFVVYVRGEQCEMSIIIGCNRGCTWKLGKCIQEIQRPLKMCLRCTNALQVCKTTQNEENFSALDAKKFLSLTPAKIPWNTELTFPKKQWDFFRHSAKFLTFFFNIDLITMNDFGGVNKNILCETRIMWVRNSSGNQTKNSLLHLYSVDYVYRTQSCGWINRPFHLISNHGE